MEETLEDLRKLYIEVIPKDGVSCVYCCSAFATDKEHVTPISWIERAKELQSMGLDVKVPEEKIVMSCNECNMIASARIFDTFLEKRSYIRYKLAKKYKKWIDREEWEDYELEELGGELRRRTVLYNEVLKAVKRRLKRINATSILKNIDYFDELYLR